MSKWQRWDSNPDLSLSKVYLFHFAFHSVPLHRPIMDNIMDCTMVLPEWFQVSDDHPNGYSLGKVLL